MRSDRNLITDLISRITRSLRALQFAEGLNPAQWDALRYIARANCYSRSPGALAVFLGVGKGTASQTLIALERKKLIRRRQIQDDKRAVSLDLTGKGQELLRRDPLLNIERSFARLPQSFAPPTELSLAFLADHLRIQSGGRIFGTCTDCENAAPASSGFCQHAKATVPSVERKRICVHFNAGP